MPGNGDPLNYVTSGQQFKPSADAWNAFVDMARRAREGGRPHVPNTIEKPYNQAIVRALNATDDEDGGPFDLPVFSVVTLTDGTPTNPGDACYEGWFNARSPGHGTTGDPTTELIGVTLDPIPAGSDFMGRVCILGLVPVIVSGGLGDGFCDAIMDERGSLTTMPNGRFAILSEPTAFNDRENVAFVMLGAGVGVKAEWQAVMLTDRAQIDLGGGSVDYQYAWNPLGEDGDHAGTLAARIIKVKIQTADGLNPTIYSVIIKGATGGAFTATEAGGSPTTAIAYDASASTIAALMVDYTTVTGSGADGDPYLFTGKDGTDYTLAFDGGKLTPKFAHSPAYWLSPIPMDIPMPAWLKLWDGRAPSVFVEVTQHGDPDAETPIPTIFTFSFANVVEGTFTGTFDEGDPSASITWASDLSATDVQTALNAVLGCTVTKTDGVFTVTVVADNDDHELHIATSSLDGDKRYRAALSNGNACTAPIAGVWPQGIDGWSGPPTPVVAINGSTSAVTGVGPFTLAIVNATSGSYQIVLDGGSPVSTTFSACPSSLSGLTIGAGPSTATSSSCILTGDGTTSHTLQAYGAMLRPVQPRQFLTISPDQCVELMSPVQCSTGGA